MLKTRVSSTPKAGQLSQHDQLRYIAVQSFLTKLARGAKLVASSVEVAEEVFRGRSPMSYGRKIRVWAAFYMLHLCLPPIVQGKHQKVKPLLCENDILEQCRSYLLGLARDGVRV